MSYQPIVAPLAAALSNVNALIIKCGHEPEIRPFDTITHGHAGSSFPMLMS